MRTRNIWSKKFLVQGSICVDIPPFLMGCRKEVFKTIVYYKGFLGLWSNGMISGLGPGDVSSILTSLRRKKKRWALML